MTAPKPRSCPICDVMFPSITKMEAHRKGCTLTCSGCQAIFKTKAAFKKHSDGCKVPCPDCAMRFKSERHLAEHRQQEHEVATPWKCSECDKQFARQDKLKRHMDELHKGKKRKIASTDISCPCGYTSGWKHNFDRHASTCPAHRKGACAFLQKAFAQEPSSSDDDVMSRAIRALQKTRDAAASAINRRCLVDDASCTCP